MASRKLAVAAFAATLAVVGATAPAARAADGAAIFADRCAACHQADAEGAPGVAPPLRSSVWPVLGETAPRYISLILLNGLTGRLEVDGQVFNGGMPTHASLSNEELAAVANHILHTVNGLTVSATPDLIASLRSTPRRAAELKAMRAGSGS